MIDITITYSYTKDYLNPIRDIFWETIFTRKKKLYIIIILIFAIFLILGYIFDDSKVNTYSLSENKFGNIGFIISNIFLGLGIGLLLYGLFLISNFVKVKNALTLIFNTKFSTFANEFSYQFNSNGITFKNETTTIERKWEFYSKFSQTNSFLILFSKNIFDKSPATIIPVDIISKDQMKEITSLLESKIG
ncbi:hypothetical protein AAON49_08690 [Pseudotenacibaculum sp. MALMAid0570]|mgnify:CR=1 FL=1|uniref:hypothetical protein n=1 Tax=Pseudotenacibaculum sp. MALMAid0570 TaxID=3143938 RepID=UPI0032DEA518